ncbi:MAG TPA: dTDP-glucose 4,6-dehydratase [Armatimonadota bacterium]|nr:dTDP-glucose 4,6-dehydratase [Armatimonadota bacterium]
MIEHNRTGQGARIGPPTPNNGGDPPPGDIGRSQPGRSAAAGSYQPRRALITGGAGFIGANFIHYWLETDPAVWILNLDALTYAGAPENLNSLPDPDRYRFVQGDICDEPLVNRLLREHEIDTIVHFAAESHVDRSIAGPKAFVRTNVTGTFTLLEAARQYWGETADMSGRRFHHISTDEVYGTLGPTDPPFTEETPYAPNSPYAATKAASDHLVRSYHHTYGLPTTTSNCSNNYGPFQHDEKFIPTVIRSCVQQKAIPVYGDGSNIRDWLFVRDHCSGIDRVIRNGALGSTYNIGGANEWNNISICREICRIMDERRPAGSPHERLISFVTDRPGHDWRYAIDASKIAKLGWSPEETFETGIRKTVDWYLAKWRQ